MTDPDIAPVRGVRGVLVGVTAGVAGFTAHTAGGGMLPDQTTLALLMAVSAVVGVAVARTRRRADRFAVLVATLTVAQVGAHLAASAATGHQHLTPAMLTAHAAGVVVGAVLIGAAERAYRLGASRLDRVVPQLVVSVPVERPFTILAPAYRPRVHRTQFAATVAPDRGPPNFV